MNIRNILSLLVAVALTACSTDEHDIPSPAPHTHLTVPVEIHVDNASLFQNRATGDPGIDKVLPPPTHLYLFSWIKLSGENYQLIHTAHNFLSENWVYLSPSETTSRYRLLVYIPLEFTYDQLESAVGEQVGRTYAVASTRALTGDQLISIVGTTRAAAITSAGIPLGLSSSPDADLRQALVNFAGWTSTDFRDLYSSPADDTGSDPNGYIISNSSEKVDLTHSDIRLYHAAAKFDFTWEVDKTLQATTALQSITVNNLPTQCTMFAPAKNPTNAPTMELAISESNADAPLNPGNKWIGRECIYGLQPRQADGGADISYEVAFANNARPNASRLFEVETPNIMYTSWYRIIATVKP